MTEGGFESRLCFYQEESLNTVYLQIKIAWSNVRFYKSTLNLLELIKKPINTKIPEITYFVVEWHVWNPYFLL